MQELVVIAVATLFSYVLCRVLVRFSERLNALNQNSPDNQIRWASHSKPLVGGIAFFLVFVLGLVFYYTTSFFSNEAADSQVLPLFLVSTLGFLVGLADDAYTTKPFLKFIGQFGCGALLIAFGHHIRLFDTVWLDYPLTMLWVVGIMNSINMLDNMDGITGSVAFGIFGTSVILMSVLGMTTGPTYMMGLLMVGALAGYLVLNWYPSKLFMGDTGSQFLGAILAFYGIELFWNMPGESTEVVFSRQLLMGVLAFLMPIIDTTFVTVARLKRGQSPFVGGRDHTTHHLSYIGLSQRVIPIVTLSVTVLSGALVILSAKMLENWSHFHTLLYSGYILVMFGIFFILYRKGHFVYQLREARKRREMQTQERERLQRQQQQQREQPQPVS